MKISVVFELLDHAFVASFGLEHGVANGTELEHHELQSDTERAEIGFRPNDEWEDEDDKSK